MTSFDFLFTLFGLVLGLAMAEALGGFVRALKARTLPDAAAARPRIGWLTPMLTLIVIFDLITCWGLAWTIRTHVPMSLLTMIGGTGFVTVYFIVAGLLWPDAPGEWPDIDDWFDRHKAPIGLLLGGINIAFAAVSVLGGRYSGVPYLQVIYVALLFALALTRSRRQSLAVLAALSGLYVWVGVNATEYWKLT